MTTGTYKPGSSFSQTSPYGQRSNPFDQSKSEFHPGVDYAAPSGTSIPAAASGLIVYSGFNAGGYGNVVIIETTGESGIRFYTLYAHMNGANMAEYGTYVNFGEKISEVGSTGRSTAPHLHFELLDSTAPINRLLKYLSTGPRQIALMRFSLIPIH